MNALRTISLRVLMAAVVAVPAFAGFAQENCENEARIERRFDPRFPNTKVIRTWRTGAGRDETLHEVLESPAVPPLYRRSYRLANCTIEVSTSFLGEYLVDATGIRKLNLDKELLDWGRLEIKILEAFLEICKPQAKSAQSAALRAVDHAQQRGRGALDDWFSWLIGKVPLVEFSSSMTCDKRVCSISFKADTIVKALRDERSDKAIEFLDGTHRLHRLAAMHSQNKKNRDGTAAIALAEILSFASSDHLPLDRLFCWQWGACQIGAPAAWSALSSSSKNPAETHIFLIDSGYDGTHPELESRVCRNRSVCKTICQACPDDARFDRDENGHGTHLLGVIGAVWNEELFAGLDRASELSMLHTFNALGVGSEGDVIEALCFAAEEAGKYPDRKVVVGMPFGSDTPTSGCFDRALAYAKEKDVLVVAAAGTGVRDIDTKPFWPASYGKDSAHPHLLVVGGTDPCDRRVQTSNWGCQTVDLGAPGTAIASTWPEGSLMTKSGTSVATAYAMGAAAIVRSQYPDKPATINERLRQCSASSSSLGHCWHGRRLDLAAALTCDVGGPLPSLSTCNNQTCADSPQDCPDFLFCTP